MKATWPRVFKGHSLALRVIQVRLREVVTSGGFTRFRRATETPFNLGRRAVRTDLLGEIGNHDCGELTLGPASIVLHNVGPWDHLSLRTGVRAGSMPE